MSTETETLIESPVGNLQFLAIKNKVKNKPQDEEASVYTVRVEFDGNTKEGKAFKAALEKVNKKIISTTHATAPGNFTVKASSQFYPRVVNASGEVMAQEEAPVFYAGSTGQCAIIVKSYMGNKLGGGINLIGIAIKELQIAEKPEGDTGGTSDIVARLRASLGK